MHVLYMGSFTFPGTCMVFEQDDLWNISRWGWTSAPESPRRSIGIEQTKTGCPLHPAGSTLVGTCHVDLWGGLEARRCCATWTSRPDSCRLRKRRPASDAVLGLLFLFCLIGPSEPCDVSHTPVVSQTCSSSAVEEPKPPRRDRTCRGLKSIHPYVRADLFTYEHTSGTTESPSFPASWNKACTYACEWWTGTTY